MLGVKILLWDPRHPFPSSPLTSTAWESRYMEAYCKRNSSSRRKPILHRAPVETCNCGIHGLSALWLLQYYANDVLHEYLRAERPHLFVCLLEGSGEIVLHETGWRAESVEILGVASFPSQVPDKETFSVAYRAASYFNVPILNFHEINEALLWSYHKHHKPLKREQVKRGVHATNFTHPPSPVKPRDSSTSPYDYVHDTAVSYGWEGVIEQMRQEMPPTLKKDEVESVDAILCAIAQYQEVALCEEKKLSLHSQLLRSGLIHVLPSHFARQGYRYVKLGCLDIDGELLSQTPKKAKELLF